MIETTLESKPHIPWFVVGDWDGCFALFFSGLPDLLLIAGLAPLCGFPASLVATRILPGVALSILGGNIFYSWQAHRLAERTGRNDVTAIPFGVNAPTIFAYIFLIMLPVYERTHDSNIAWQAGVFACFLSGIVQTAGAFCTDWLRRHTPRAALLCPLAGIAMAFLCMGFVLRIFQVPSLALLPVIIILTIFSARVRLPFRLPGGLVGIAIAGILAGLLKLVHAYPLPITPPIAVLGFHPPIPINLFQFLLHSEGWKYLAIILPMSLADAISSLQILESVNVAGDDYPTMPSLLVNGIATLVAAAFGSPFPTTLYLGHMAHKSLGARAGYSVMSGAATTLVCLTGLVSPLLRVVPLETVGIIVVWFGLIMVAQSFTEIPRSHAIAVAFGLMPLLASWAIGLVDVALRKGGSSFLQAAPSFGDELPIYGLIALSQGSLLVSMVWAAAIAFLLDRRFLQAAAWLGAASVLSFFGLIHAFRITNQGVENVIGFLAAPAFAASYLAGAVFLVAFHFYATRPGTVVESREIF